MTTFIDPGVHYRVGVRIFFLTLICFATSMGRAAPLASRVNDSQPMVQPADLFPDFPAIKFGMSYPDVKKAVETKGFQVGGNQNELAWEGKFGGIDGRGTTHFKEQRAVQISAVVYAMDKRNELYEQWSKKFSERHGVGEETDSTDVRSKLWRLKTGIAIELRLIKDENSPVVDVRWVKL